jgi:hypothetical protein
LSGKKKQHDEDVALDRSAPSSRTIHKAILFEGFQELGRPSSALFWSALAAGLSMGLSVITEGLLRAHLPQAQWTPLVTKLGYSMGFLVVVLGRQQLFTENTLTAVLPVLRRRTRATLINLARLGPWYSPATSSEACLWRCTWSGATVSNRTSGTLLWQSGAMPPGIPVLRASPGESWPAG